MNYLIPSEKDQVIPITTLNVYKAVKIS